jgi:hypothetical protein
MSPATMFPVHDHVDGTGGPLVGHEQWRNIGLDDYHHDWRCSGECGPCGGNGGVPGDAARYCLHCSGSGHCSGCNAYLYFEAR